MTDWREIAAANERAHPFARSGSTVLTAPPHHDDQTHLTALGSPPPTAPILDRVIQRAAAAPIFYQIQGLIAMTDWLKSWSGKLSAFAALIAGWLTVDPSLLISALAFMPAGPVRIVLLVLIVVATIWLPKKAAEKDANTD